MFQPRSRNNDRALLSPFKEIQQKKKQLYPRVLVENVSVIPEKSAIY
jgi:hypothetical protein